MIRVLRGPERSGLRLSAVVAAVVVVHLLLLMQATLPPLLGPSKNTKASFTINLLPAQVDSPAQVSPEEAPQDASQQGTPPQDASQASEGTDTYAGKTGSKPSAPAQAGGLQKFPGTGAAPHDDQVSLDYQLADIQGAGLRMGNLTLSLKVQGGKYESRSLWNFGEDRGESISSGVADSMLRPGFFSEDGRLARSPTSGTPQDLLSVVWNLRNLAMQRMSQSPPSYGPVWEVPVLWGNATPLVHWRLEPMDNLIVPAGRFRGAKMVGTIDQDDVTRLTVWYAVDFDFVPVRIEKRDASGRTQDAKISTTLERRIVAQ